MFVRLIVISVQVTCLLVDKLFFRYIILQAFYSYRICSNILHKNIYIKQSLANILILLKWIQYFDFAKFQWWWIIFHHFSLYTCTVLYCLHHLNSLTFHHHWGPQPLHVLLLSWDFSSLFSELCLFHSTFYSLRLIISRGGRFLILELSDFQKANQSALRTAAELFTGSGQQAFCIWLL